MAKITSKAQLNVGTEIIINEPARTIQLVQAGNLVFKDGMTLQAVYSKLVVKPGYIPYYIRNLPLTAADSSIPVALTPDRNYA